MPVSQQSYPDWVRAFRTRGTVVKKVNERYYLYKRTSKRIPGKKYPQPVDTYIGLITENGVVKADKNLIPVNEPCIVKEYGFSRALLLRCPDNWKKAAGDDWSEILKLIIVSHSPRSYLTKEGKLHDKSEYNCSWGGKGNSLSRNMYERYHCDLRSLEPLKYIYAVYAGKKRIISEIDDEQKEILKKLEIKDLEVD